MYVLELFRIKEPISETGSEGLDEEDEIPASKTHKLNPDTIGKVEEV